ncbi:MAG: hypothetical protein JOZ41_15385 [Chloroflexi bacterium]|nr:hypothetical protein [Chloroflexota bacterium]
MAVPSDRKQQAIYHAILAEMHRVHALLLNLQTIEDPDTEKALRDYFTREQTLTLGKLTEWKQRRPEVYRQASDDFQNQIRREGGGGG